MDPTKVKVEEKKLGRHRAHGLQWPGVIHIDSRLRGKKQMEIFVHEYLHEICPEWDEAHVTTQAKKMATFLWKHGFRRDEARQPGS
jgi:hypothetical protein